MDWKLSRDRPPQFFHCLTSWKWLLLQLLWMVHRQHYKTMLASEVLNRLLFLSCQVSWLCSLERWSHDLPHHDELKNPKVSIAVWLPLHIIRWLLTFLLWEHAIITDTERCWWCKHTELHTPINCKIVEKSLKAITYLPAWAAESSKFFYDNSCNLASLAFKYSYDFS